MMEKMLKDFSIQKEFSENASHEMQTPLAIIKSKLELLIQSENYTEEQAKFIQDISETVSRLSRINQALLLIARIDNKQYPLKENLDIVDIIKKHLDNFEELIAAKSIDKKVYLQTALHVSMNPLLADLLITNLISNAIRHNLPNGKLYISQTRNSIVIENTGEPLSINPEMMFERFRKGRVDSNSHGLGLSIVKKIADSCNVQIDYLYDDGFHSFRLIFDI
jgi:signal transduction histidine kinase